MSTSAQFGSLAASSNEVPLIFLLGRDDAGHGLGKWFAVTTRASLVVRMFEDHERIFDCNHREESLRPACGQS